LVINIEKLNLRVPVGGKEEKSGGREKRREGETKQRREGEK